jgi:hypothetical protein
LNLRTREIRQKKKKERHGRGDLQSRPAIAEHARELIGYRVGVVSLALGGGDASPRMRRWWLVEGVDKERCGAARDAVVFVMCGELLFSRWVELR